MVLRDSLVRYLIGLAIAMVGLLSGYYAAYTGLKVELATKAEGRYVDEVDIRVARLEAMINERFATKDDLADFKNEIVSRLTALETTIRETNEISR
jgi:hypothetical protein